MRGQRPEAMRREQTLDAGDLHLHRGHAFVCRRESRRDAAVNRGIGAARTSSVEDGPAAQVAATGPGRSLGPHPAGTVQGAMHPQRRG
jgi:hypothetical protein